jgi:hypothetical protein
LANPEAVTKCASAVLITKYGPAHLRILDNRLAAKAQQHLEFSASAAPCPVPPTHLIFIRLVNIVRNQLGIARSHF